jgi:phenylacetate-CoA ligase
VAALSTLRALQLGKLRELLRIVARSNRFYREKLRAVGFESSGASSFDLSDPSRSRSGSDSAVELESLLDRLPLTTKREFESDQAAHPPYGTNLSFSLSDYTRVHETSGTSGQPLRWLDTPESWRWFLGAWNEVYSGIGLRPEDRLYFPFSFGPFIGFWGAFEAAFARGNFCLPGGGLSSLARLRAIETHGATVVACTPTYGLRLAEVARQHGIDLRRGCVRALIVAGEPGGSVPTTRAILEEAWGARVFDHCGMTESGAFGFEPFDSAGTLRVIESEFIVEVLRTGSTSRCDPGEAGELVLTNLGRTGSPIIRYRTGDLVRWFPGGDGRANDRHPAWGRLEGGILARLDDMVIVRGNNVYPSAIEAIVRRFREVAEYRVLVLESSGLTRLVIELELTDPLESLELSQSGPSAPRLASEARTGTVAETTNDRLADSPSGLGSTDLEPSPAAPRRSTCPSSPGFSAGGGAVLSHGLESDSPEGHGLESHDLENDSPEGHGSEYGRPDAGVAADLSNAIRDALKFQADVRIVPKGSLPRPEHKARRFHRVRDK